MNMISFARENSSPLELARDGFTESVATAKECLAEANASIKEVVNKNPAAALATALAAGVFLGWLIKRR